jgi:CHAT domain-containing protein/Tfp pilus assembly protein PilF
MHRRSCAALVSLVSTVIPAALALLAPVPLLAQQTAAPSSSAAPAMPASIEAKLDPLQAALQAARAGGDARAEAKALNGIGDVYFNLSEFGKALDFYNRALTQARAAKDAQQAAAALNGVASVNREQGDKDKAQQGYKQALDVATASGDLVGQATALNGQGWLMANDGQWEKALALHQQALGLARRTADDDLQAIVLLRIGQALAATGQLDKAKEAAAQALAIFQRVGDAEGEANTLGAMAVGYKNIQDNQRALQLGMQALVMFRESGDQRGVAAALRGIGLVLMALGQPDRALESLNRALAVSRLAGDPSSEAMTLVGIGTVDSVTGQKQKALEAHNQALEMFRAGGDRAGEALALNSIGSTYIALGERQKAIDSFNQALPLYRGLGNRDGEATTLGNLGVACFYLGEWQKARDFYNEALSIYVQLSDRAGGANMLTSIGTGYLVLGESEKALEYYGRALPLYRSLSNQYGAANVLNNIGFAYGKMGEWQKALEPLQQALALDNAIGDRPHQADTLTILSAAYDAVGEKQKALDVLNQALPIRREVGDLQGEAATLDQLGVVYNDLGQSQKAQESLQQALPLAREVGNPIQESQVLNDLMLSVKSTQPALAVFYGKQAVNLLQQLRGNIQGLDQGLQTSFLVSKEDYYHGLADLLIAQGRLPEAQQVLDLLKRQEYSDFTRGDTTNPMSPLTLTPAEQQASQDYQKTTTDVVAMGREWAELRKISARTPEQETRFKQVSDQLQTASAGLSDYYKRLYVLLGSGDNANNKLKDVRGEVSSLSQILARMPHTVALYTLVGKDRYRVIVVTGTTQVARESAIGEEDLNKKIAAFEQALRNRTGDPKPAAQDLYNILIGPVKQDLDQAQAETLVWSLDGALRYVPMAALYDGKRYLVEKFKMVTITPVSIQYLAEKPDVSNLSVAAMGISRQYESQLPELKAVVGELDEIAKDPHVSGANGVLPGTVLLNNEFTEKAMEAQFSGDHTVVHIASHFVFRPGDSTNSYLLLADNDKDGKAFHLTVDDFNNNPNLTLTNTDLLTLSACETGMSGNAGNGREVDGLGTSAVTKGARAVISSLWEVNDASTGQLMADFYRRWSAGGGSVEKVEALRQAQLDLLQGKVEAQAGGAGRGVESVDDTSAPATGGFSHPYYWAPFVLMGNWR